MARARHAAGRHRGAGRVSTVPADEHEGVVSIDRPGRSTAELTGVRVAPVASVEDVPVTPDAVEFVRFCYRRSGVGWPDLYDEMCAVASRAAYRGLGYDELCRLGIGFSLPDMPRMAAIAQRVIEEERRSRPPVFPPVLAAN
jgi:hypothetical protein